MTDRHEALERLRSINPVPGVDLLNPDEVTSVVALCEERRLTPDTEHRQRPEPVTRRGVWRSARVFAAAFAAIIVAVGIIALIGRETAPVVNEPPPVATTVPQALPVPDPIEVSGVAVGDDGSLWAATTTGVARWLPGSRTATTYTTEDGLPDDNVYRIVAGSEGVVWVGAPGWMARFDGSWTTYSAPAGSAGPMAIGPDGAVWSAFGERQLGRFDGSHWDVFDAPLTLDHGLALPWTGFIDVAPDGTVWTGTYGYQGVFAFNDPDWVHYTTVDGLPSEALGTIAVAPDGSVWVGSAGMDEIPGGGVSHFDGSAWTVYTADDGLLSNTADVAVGGDGTVWAIHTGPDGTGVSHFDGATWTAYPDVLGVGMFASVDDSGTLWMPSRSGVIGFDGTGVTRLLLPVDEPPEAKATPIPPTDEWNPILSTTAARTAPPAATCPPGTNPNAPGPAGRERPAPGWVGNLAAAFDRHAGRIVYVDTLGETWTFDVCTNTWHRMDPAGAIIGELSAGLVYDVDSDITVALGYEGISVYDANTNTWTQPSNDIIGLEDDQIVPYGAAYDSMSGLIVTTTFSFEGTTERWDVWAYDVDANDWTPIGPVPLDRTTRCCTQIDLLGYSHEIDRFILTGFVENEEATLLVDPRTGETNVISTPTSGVDLGWPSAAYGPAADTVYVTDHGDPFGSAGLAMCGFDTKALAWECNPAPNAVPGHTVFAAVVGDPINDRLILINGVYGSYWVNADNDVWAIDLDTGDWAQLLAPSD